MGKFLATRHRNKRGSQGFGVMRFCGNFYFKVRYCSVQSPSRVGGNFNFTSRYYWWKKILPRNDLLPFLKYDNSTNPKRWTRTGYLKTESNSRLHQIHFQLDLSDMRNLHAGECQLMKKYSASSIFDFIDFNIIITDVFLSVTKVFIRKAKRLSKYEDGVV